MSMMRFGVGVLTLVSVLALSWFLPVLDTDSTGAPIPTRQADQEKQKILKGVSAGQVLYLMSIQYERKDPGIPGRAWALPEHVLGEIWMAQDASGAPAIFTTVTRNTEGEVLSYSQLENGHRVGTWVATGDKTSITMDDEATLASWVLNVWQTGTRLLDSGYAFVGTGRWYGQPTAIYEDTRTISINISNFTAAQREAMGVSSDQTTVKEVFVDSYEHVVDRPLLYRSATWSTDEAGARTLTGDFRIVEYRLLPADTPIGPFDK